LTRAPAPIALEEKTFQGACKDASSSSFIERPLIAEAVLNARWNEGSTLKFKSFDVGEGEVIC